MNRILSKSNGISIVENTCMIFQSCNVYLARDFWHAVGSFNSCLVFGLSGTCHAPIEKARYAGLARQAVLAEYGVFDLLHLLRISRTYFIEVSTVKVQTLNSTIY